MKPKAKRYTPEERDLILKEWQQLNLTLEEAAEKFKVSKNSLSNWKKSTTNTMPNDFVEVKRDRIMELILQDKSRVDTIIELFLDGKLGQ